MRNRGRSVCLPGVVPWVGSGITKLLLTGGRSQMGPRAMRLRPMNPGDRREGNTQ